MELYFDQWSEQTRLLSFVVRRADQAVYGREAGRCHRWQIKRATVAYREAAVAAAAGDLCGWLFICRGRPSISRPRPTQSPPPAAEPRFFGLAAGRSRPIGAELIKSSRAGVKYITNDRRTTRGHLLGGDWTTGSSWSAANWPDGQRRTSLNLSRAGNKTNDNAAPSPSPQLTPPAQCRRHRRRRPHEEVFRFPILIIRTLLTSTRTN